jgi:MarR family transcriptional regulator, temperature-dependent positive regulator of motility
VGVSVGKAHYLLKSLVDKGMVKAKNFRRSDNKLGYLYVLTPTGVKQRWLLTRAFLARKEAEYETLKGQIATLRGEMAAGGVPDDAAAR